MTDLASRPLPVDMATLRTHYMPPPPADSAVTRARAAIARLDALMQAARAQLDQLEQADRAAAVELADAALDHGPLEPLAARLDPGDRAVLAYRADRLQAAWSVAADRHTRAEHTDEQQLTWRAECDRVMREWQHCMAVEDPDDRFRLLAAFAAVH